MNEAPAVTAIVLNFNGRGFVDESVKSLLEQEFDGLEVIVVDNASVDGSAEEIEAAFGSRVRLLRSARNLGFGGGNNLGIREARGRHIVLLNNDAVAAPAFVHELVTAAEADRTIGMVAAKVLLFSEPGVIDTMGHLLYPDGLNRGRGRLERDEGQYDQCSTALFPSGAAALYTRRMLDDVGLFEESLFLYGDDTELGLRGRLAGWGCALAPGAVAYHHYSRSVGAYSSQKAFYVERNRVLVLCRTFPVALIVVSPAFTAGRLTLQAWAALTGRGASARLAAQAGVFHLVGVTLRAYGSALAALPRILGERWRNRHRRRMSTREFLALMAEHRLRARDAAFRD